MQVLTTWKNTENYYIRAELEAFIIFAVSEKFDVKKTQPTKSTEYRRLTDGQEKRLSHVEYSNNCSTSNC